MSISDPPTRTGSIPRGLDGITLTMTSGGSTYTSVEAKLETDAYTKTEIANSADDFDWYGSAKPSCVRSSDLATQFERQLTITKCSSCTVAAQIVHLFYFPTRKLHCSMTPRPC